MATRKRGPNGLDDRTSDDYGAALDMAELEDAMARYARGHDASFGVVYDLAAPTLYPFLVKLSRDRTLAEDLTHDAFLRVHGARGSYRLGARVMPWLFAIGRRLFLDKVRARRREGPSLDAPGSDGEPAGDPGIASREPAADQMLIGTSLALRIEALLGKMTETQATAYRLLKEEQLTVAEAAAVLGTTETAVKLRAHRAYESLREALGREWDLADTSAGAGRA